MVRKGSEVVEEIERIFRRGSPRTDGRKLEEVKMGNVGSDAERTVRPATALRRSQIFEDVP
jgi:hypothetical protein